MSFLKDISIDKIRNAAEDVYNQAKPKTDLEAKVYEVLSHKNWGASTTLLNEVARESFDYDKFPVITRLIWEAMDSRPAAWRVIFKGLTLCEHLIKHGSERCVDDARYHSHQLRSLQKFNYYEGTVDRGIGVREKAKQVVELLGDDERIREERNKAKALRDKFGGTGDMSGIGSGGGGSSGGGGGTDRYSGYGNSGGGGYGGDKGISSSYGGAGAGGASDTHGFSGRYSDKNSSSSGGTKSNEASSYSAEPTFASIPDSTKPATKKKTKKKKKKATTTAAVNDTPASAPPSAPEVDLFSFDSPEPAPATTAAPTPNGDEFDAFTSARAAPATSAFDNTPVAAATNDDLFGAFSGSRAQTAAPTQAAIVDPFATNTAPATVPNMHQTSFNNPAMMSSPQMNMMQGGVGNGMVSQFSNSVPTDPNNAMSGTKIAAAVSQQPADSDDFGDFSGATTSPKLGSADPISKLINLDSLSLNKKKEDKAHAPILYNVAAQQSFMTQQYAPKTDTGNEMAFSGLDGIQKPMNFSIKSNSGGHRNAGQPIMSTMTSQPSTQTMPSSQMMGGNMQGMMGSMQAGGMMPGMQAAGMMGGTQGANMVGVQGGNMMSGMQGGNMMGGTQGANMMGGMQGANMMGNVPQQMMGGMQGANMGGMQSGGMMGGANTTGGMANMQTGGMMGGQSSMGQPMNQTNMPSAMGNDAGWHGFTS